MLFTSWLRNWKRSLEHKSALLRTRRRRTPARRHVSRLLLEALEDRTLLSPVLSLNSTVAVAVVNGSPDVATSGGQLIALNGGGGNSAGPVTNGTQITDGGTWTDTTTGATVTLTSSQPGLSKNADGTWSWSGTTPTGTGPVTITATDNQGDSTSIQFWLNVGQVFQVTNTGDNGGVNPAAGAETGTLRQAIIDANNASTTGGPSLIASAIPASDSGYNSNTGKFTISLSASLPTMTNAVNIDGFSQPGSSANTLPGMGAGAGDNAFQNIILDGSDIGSSGDGLAIAAGGSTVQGLVIQNFSTDIHLTTNGNDLIAGNYLTNAVHGVFVDNVPNNTVGGTTPGARNVFGDNNTGISIQGTGATGNQVQGNYIGTDGSQLLATHGVNNNTVIIAVFISDASNNVVGGTEAGAGNIIATSQRGVEIVSETTFPAPTSGNLIEGNYIGLNAAGTDVIPGLGSEGVDLGIGSNIVGGTTSSARNIISGWSGAEVWLSYEFLVGAYYGPGNISEGNYIGTDAAGSKGFAADANATGVFGHFNDVISDNLISGIRLAIDAGNTRIQGNKIGTDATGTLKIPNGLGIRALSGDLIGGTTPGTGNTIAYNNGPAVEVVDTGNAIEGNSIYGNAGPYPAIDNLDQSDYPILNSSFVETNWPGGPFNASTPTLSGLTLNQSGSTLTYNGTLIGLPNNIDYVELPVISPDGTYFGSYSPGLANTDANGQATFTNLSYPAPPGFPTTQGALAAYAQVQVDTPANTDNATFSGLTLTQSGSTLTYSGTLIDGQANMRYLVALDANDSQGNYWGSDFAYLTTDSSGQVPFTVNFPAPWPSGVTPGTPSATVTPAHSQGNYEQNYPVLSSASSSSTDTSISGTLNGQANTTFRIEFFSNPAADPSGYGQGQTYLGYANVTTDANGNVTFTTDLAVGNLAGQWITATATDPFGNTSQFSADTQATAAPSQTYAQYLQAAVPQSSSTVNSMTIYASSAVSPSTVINAVNGLTNMTQPVTIILDLGGGIYSSGGAVANPPPNVTFKVQNGTLDPNYPALTVAGGQVVVSNCTLTTSGNTPTLLVTGGSVTLSNDDINQTSTVYTQPAIAVIGGTVNLGTAATPGNNTLSVNSSGDLVNNTSGNAISAVGDTFQVGGTVESAANLSFTTLTSSAATSTLNQAVTLTATVQANGSSGTPTGSIDFFDTSTNTDLGSVSLSGGVATLTTSTLAPGDHVIAAKYSGDANFLPSANTFTQSVHYVFSGFLPPLSNGLAFAENRTIPIKLTLTDFNGNPVTNLSAVTSLQIQALDANGNPVGAPFNPASTSNQGLQYSGGQYQFNWQTKGLAAGSYEIVLKLADGTTHTQTIQLTGNGNGANAQATDGSDVSDGGTAGQLLGGDVDLYVDNSNGDLTPDELARIQDAVNAVDATIAPYGIAINEVTDPTQADVTLNMGTNSAVGGFGQGILGCYTTTGTITLIQGWNWYAGSDPTQIGASQYDFQTTVTHELGHALGLGESDNTASAMYGTLAPGTVIRALTTADLNIPYDDGSADAQRAALPSANAVTGTVVGNNATNGQSMTTPSSTSIPSSPMSGTDQLFAELAGILSAARNAYQSELSSMSELWQQADGLALQRLDTLLSMEAGAMGVTKDSLMRDLLVASSFSPNDV